MSIVATEVAGGTEISRDIDGRYSASRSFLVYEDDGAALSIGQALSAALLPLIGENHPDVSGAICGGFTIRESPERKETYDITYQYAMPEDVEVSDDPSDPLGDDGATFGGGEGGVIDGAEPDSGVTSFSIKVGVSIVDIWKSSPSMPSSKNNPARLDIGGTLVSEGGYPISFAMPTASITIKTQWSGYFDVGQVISRVGRRNSSHWRGFSAGSVLFTGVDVNQDTVGMNDVSYELAFDMYSHLRQVPERDEDGNPKVNLSTDPPSLDVFFKQPFPKTTSFGFLPF